MKNILKYLFYFVFLLLAKNSFASQLAGNEITYKWVDTLKW